MKRTTKMKTATAETTIPIIAPLERPSSDSSSKKVSIMIFGVEVTASVGCLCVMITSSSSESTIPDPSLSSRLSSSSSTLPLINSFIDELAGKIQY